MARLCDLKVKALLLLFLSSTFLVSPGVLSGDHPGREQAPRSELSMTLCADGSIQTPNYPVDTVLQWRADDSLSGLEFQQSYCSRFCVNETELAVLDTGADDLQGACVPCSCEKPKCYFYGICCPDMEQERVTDAEDDQFGLTPNQGPVDHTAIAQASRGPVDHTATAQAPRGPVDHTATAQAPRGPVDHTATAQAPRGPVDHTAIVQAPQGNVDHTATAQAPRALVGGGIVDMPVCDNSHYLVRSCPPGYYNGETKRKCELDITSLGHVTRRILTHVTDRVTSVSFYNAYCAECHGKNQTSNWKVRLECLHYQRVYSATDEDLLFQASLHPDSTCRSEQDPPPDVIPGPSCDSKWFEHVVSSCNVTGLWPAEDGHLHGLCKNIGGLTNRVVYEAFTFSNVFCFICNFPGIKKYDPCKGHASTHDIGYGPLGGGGPYRSPFSLLLGSQRDRRPATNTTVHLLADVQIECSPGKVLENDTCFTPLDQIRGLAYRLFVFYTPLFDRAKLNLTKVTDEESLDLFLFFTSSATMKLRDLESNVILRDSIEVKQGMVYLAETNQQPDAPDSSHLFYLDAKFVSTKEYSRDEVENRLLSTFYLEDLVYKSDAYTIRFEPTSPGLERWTSYCANGLWYPQGLQCRQLPPPASFYDWYFSFGIQDAELIPVSPMLTCPFVKFKASSYSKSSRNLSLRLGDRTVQFGGNWPDMNWLSEDKITEELHVCYSLLEKMVKDLGVGNVAGVPGLTRVRFYLTRVCMGLSMLCLLLTIITYLAFPSIRSPAGINNMFLCSTLLPAQAFLLASAHMSPTGPLCAAVGISTHFLWLSMFCWTSTCCFHMFQTFTASTRSTASTGRAKFLDILKKVTFCTLTPMVVVLLVIVCSLLTSGGIAMGYGKVSCYLDSQLLAITAMIVPMSLMVLSNLSFFTVTVYKIKSIRKLQGNDVTPGAPRDIYVYVKLSSLTGGFWMLAIGAEYLDSIFVQVASDILIGLQGVFIFWSYVWNQRVLNLYRRALGLSVTITTRTGTITRIGREVTGTNTRRGTQLQ